MKPRQKNLSGKTIFHHNSKQKRWRKSVELFFSTATNAIVEFSNEHKEMHVIRAVKLVINALEAEWSCTD